MITRERLHTRCLNIVDICLQLSQIKCLSPVGGGAPAEGPGGEGKGGGPQNGFPYRHLKSTEKSEIRETNKKKIRFVIYNGFSFFYEKMKMILWSIRTFWYKGLAKIKGKSSLIKMSLFCENCNSD